MTANSTKCKCTGESSFVCSPCAAVAEGDKLRECPDCKQMVYFAHTCTPADKLSPSEWERIEKRVVDFLLCSDVSEEKLLARAIRELQSELIDANLKIAFPNGVGTDRNPPRDKSRGCYTCPNCTMENGSVVTCSEHTENAE